MRIIPAIDIMNGQCVRLEKGVFESKKVYSAEPLEVAKELESMGIQHLHLVDLDGAKKGKVVNESVVKQIAFNTGLKIDFGGGVSDNVELEKVLKAGVQQVNIGSMAYAMPEVFKAWLKKYGPEKFILSADVNNEFVAIKGWTETGTLKIDEFIEMFLPSGLKTVVCTDISKDGMLSGPSIDLYKRLIAKYDLEIIASGGVSCAEDLHQLKSIGCAGAIVGKAYYEGKIDLKTYLNA